MTFKEYIHAKEHSSMGYGPMHSCGLCGTEPEASKIISSSEIAKIAMFATVTTLLAEIVLRPLVIPKIKSVFNIK